MAATFRPSWELGEAAFSGPAGSLLESHVPSHEVPPHQGASAPHRNLNGAHIERASSGAGATLIMRPPEHSVIVDPSVIRPLPGLPSRQAPSASRTAPPSNRPAPTSVTARFPADDEPVVAKRSKTGMWIGIAAVVVAIVGGGVWLSSSAEEKRTERPVGAETPTSTKTRLAATPPEASSASRVPTAIEPPPHPVAPATTTASAPAVQVPMPTPPPPSPAAPPRAAAWAPRQSSAATWPPPAPAARPPASRPKGGNATIVRDVPF